ncbi:universal stress protein [Enterococcus sp. CSURQ0835]|uniref:universal stress protein n=1 Tax=Enterococcus sp. CSURQ0835 TaxID=2681394 RepID=UPI00135A3893|nr:universal stress protein [Enterococcus sp. CSURQ0835]
MLAKYKRILVAVDGSKQADKALAEAVEIAKRNDAELFVVQVIDDLRMLVHSATPMTQIMAEESRIAKEAFNQKRQTIDYAKAEFIVKDGNPKKELANGLPKQYAIDLIVMGATGKGAIERMLVGSTAAYVVNYAPCNVMIIK